MSSDAVATNKKARRNYEITETFEAGIVLRGSEVKSLREAQCRIDEGFARFRDSELWLFQVTISPYKSLSTHYSIEQDRPRKLLMHRQELERINSKVEQNGLSIIPLKVYFVKGNAKVQIGLGKGKKLHDKRQDIAKRDQMRDVQRELGRRNKGK